MIGPGLLDDLPHKPKWHDSDILAGHFGLLPLTYNYEYFTVLRDPLERLHSHYSHIKMDPGHYLNKLVTGEKLSFYDYLVDKRFYNSNYNLQTRYLSNYPKFTNSKSKKPEHQAIGFENSSASTVNLNLAIKTLRNSLWVGNQNNLSEIGEFLGNRFGLSNIKFPLLNVGSGSTRSFSTREIEAAQPLIALDQVIFNQWG